MADAYQVVLGMIAVSVIVLVPIGFVVAYDALAGRWDAQLKSLKAWLEEGAERRQNLRASRVASRAHRWSDSSPTCGDSGSPSPPTSTGLRPTSSATVSPTTGC